MVYVNICIYMYWCHFCGPKDPHLLWLSPDCDQNPDVQTIGISGILRRIFAKAVLTNYQGDILDVAGAPPLCAELTARMEAAVQAVRT